MTHLYMKNVLCFSYPNSHVFPNTPQVCADDLSSTHLCRKNVLYFSYTNSHVLPPTRLKYVPRISQACICAGKMSCIFPTQTVMYFPQHASSMCRGFRRHAFVQEKCSVFFLHKQSCTSPNTPQVCAEDFAGTYLCRKNAFYFSYYSPVIPVFSIP